MLANGIKETTATTGTGTVTLAAVTGFTRFANGFADGLLASYAIKDGNNWEWGIGTVGAGNTLARTTVTATLVAGTYTTTGATAITLASGAAEIICTDHTGTAARGATNKIGDIVLSQVAQDATWKLANGAVYLQADLPALYAAIGLGFADMPGAKLANPATLPTGYATGAAFDPSGTYLSITHAITPFVTIYKRSGDTFTKLANPATLPAGTGRGAAFDPSGTYLSITHAITPFVTIYKRSGDTFTKLANPAILPTGTGYGAAFDPSGTYLSIAHNATPFITIYKGIYPFNIATEFPVPGLIPTALEFINDFNRHIPKPYIKATL